MDNENNDGNDTLAGHFIDAFFLEDYDRMEQIINQGISPNEIDGEDSPCLITAIYYLTMKTVKFLLNKGANIEISDNGGVTPLMAAARSGNLDIVNLLLERGSKVEVRDNMGNTPFLLLL